MPRPIFTQSSLISIALGLLLPIASLAQTAPNPKFFYLVKGQPVERSISLGDPSNWSLQLAGREGKSASGKLTVSATDFQEQGDALQLKWAARKKVSASLGIYGNPIDISPFKDSASLTIDMRVDGKPDKPIKVSMDCGYPCRAEITINDMIATMPRGKWFSLPLALNCFKSDNFDLSKINGPFSISSDGKATLSITNIRLEKLPEGETGCREPAPAASAE